MERVSKTYRHLNFFQHECELEVRVPRVKLPDGSVRQLSPPWAGKLCGFTLLCEAFVLLLCREMPFTGVARITGVSVHRVIALCERYVDAAVGAADFSEVRRLAIDETSRAKGHEYVNLVADEQARRVIYVAEGNEAATVEAFAANLRAHHGKPTAIESVSIDMWPAFIRRVSEHFPQAQITLASSPGSPLDKPTASWRPSTVCSRLPSAGPAGMDASAPSVPSSSSSPASSTSPSSNPMSRYLREVALPT